VQIQEKFSQHCMFGEVAKLSRIFQELKDRSMMLGSAKFGREKQTEA